MSVSEESLLCRHLDRDLKQDGRAIVCTRCGLFVREAFERLLSVTLPSTVSCAHPLAHRTLNAERTLLGCNLCGLTCPVRLPDTPPARPALRVSDADVVSALKIMFPDGLTVAQYEDALRGLRALESLLGQPLPP